MLKTCPKCKVVKESLEFYKNRSRRDGFTWGVKTVAKRTKENIGKPRQVRKFIREVARNIVKLKGAEGFTKKPVRSTIYFIQNKKRPTV